MDTVKEFWEEKYKNDMPKMIGICFRYTKNKQIAEDLAHDAFVKAIDNACAYKGKGCFEAWLSRIAVNTALQYLKKQKIKKREEENLEYEYKALNYSTIKSENMDANKFSFTENELLEAINILPEHHRLVFNLYVIDNYSHKQIGEELGISSGTSKSHLARSRKKLKKHLSELQKQRLGEKEKKRNVLYFMLPATTFNVDKLCNKTFKNYKVIPTSKEIVSSINWGVQTMPVLKTSIFALSNIAIAGATIALTTTISILYISSQNNQESIQIEQVNIVTQQDTVESKVDKSIVKKSIHAPIKKIDSSKNTPAKTIVIKKKRIIQKQVIVKDTLKVKA